VALLRQQLGGQRAGITAGVTEGGYGSADGRHRLGIAKPRKPPFDTRVSRLLQQRLDAIAAAERGAVHPADDEPKPPLEVAFAGGHRIALETETVVKRESILNTVGSLALILPLLFVVFRSGGSSTTAPSRPSRRCWLRSDCLASAARPCPPRRPAPPRCSSGWEWTASS
jgi:hypothetical protein